MGYQFIVGSSIHFAVSWVGICFSQGVVHVSLLQVVSDKVRRVRLTRMVHLIVNIVRRSSCILLCLAKLSSSLLHVVLHYHPIVAELPEGFHVILLVHCIVQIKVESSFRDGVDKEVGRPRSQ